MRTSRRLFAAVAVLFVVGVVVQVFLAGLFLFTSVDRAWHMEFGYWLELPPLLALMLVWPAHVGRGTAWLTVALAVDVLVQTTLPELKDTVPLVAAVHPVNALLVLWLGVQVATRGVALARLPLPAPVETPTAPARERPVRQGS
jgi:Family of unknown function (DUF6220)